ncbi:hypothetical protein OE699_12810 [Sedimentimonas flavescens]|uniref:Uncharacterized protein n=1 Tax=Sedimentimonas flavescens TaxID=2851012 RepID=A0ABT3A155_9RHOB|nr:hypothetical protein [Sedimentimonas flavescens]MCV2879728.1 hypothetical protein [Sedimentimonas flavescens]
MSVIQLNTKEEIEVQMAILGAAIKEQSERGLGSRAEVARLCNKLAALCGENT